MEDDFRAKAESGCPGRVPSDPVSRSKLNRQPLVERHPELQQYVVACATCGREGRDAATDWDDFEPPGYGGWVREAFVTELPLLPLTESGLCHACAASAPPVR